MEQGGIAVQLRTDMGKGAARKIRREGFVPGVVYGKGTETLPLKVSERDMRQLLNSSAANRVFTLRLEGDTKTEEYPVLLKEVEYSPLRRNVLHVDFQRVAFDEEVKVEVPIVLVGEENRESDGGIVQALLRSVEVRCLPTAIPEQLEVDVSGLAIGDSVRVEDLKLSEGVSVQTSADDVVVSVLAPAISAAEGESDEEGETAEAEQAAEEQEE